MRGWYNLKILFLGQAKHLNIKLQPVSAQCCIRAGGKHNDLENVGLYRKTPYFF